MQQCRCGFHHGPSPLDSEFVSEQNQPDPPETRRSWMLLVVLLIVAGAAALCGR
jgi:hypothetical protein